MSPTNDLFLRLIRNRTPGWRMICITLSAVFAFVVFCISLTVVGQQAIVYQIDQLENGYYVAQIVVPGLCWLINIFLASLLWFRTPTRSILLSGTFLVFATYIIMLVLFASCDFFDPHASRPPICKSWDFTVDNRIRTLQSLRICVVGFIKILTFVLLLAFHVHPIRRLNEPAGRFIAPIEDIELAELATAGNGRRGHGFTE